MPNPNNPRPAGGQQRGRFQMRRKVCYYCNESNASVDYKQVEVLRRFVTERGKIKPRRQSGLCARHQRLAAVAIKRARHVALLPFVSEPGQSY